MHLNFPKEVEILKLSLLEAQTKIIEIEWKVSKNGLRCYSC